MPKDVFVDFAGVMKLDHKTTFTLVGLGEGLQEEITVTEWTELTPENRSKYILTSFNDASRKADEFDITQIFFRIE